MRNISVLLAGNPNVGKSTVFNALTGLKQHTGNWTGKTVAAAVGTFQFHQCQFVLTDLPGTYSLNAGSPDEIAAQNSIMLDNPDCVIIVADACCLERNLHLVLQILEITHKAVLCLNLMDEARKKQIQIDISRLSQLLGIPVIPTAARSMQGIDRLIQTTYRVSDGQIPTHAFSVRYDSRIENTANMIADILPLDRHRKRFLSLRLLDSSQRENILEQFDIPLSKELREALERADKETASFPVRDSVFQTIVSCSEAIYQQCVSVGNPCYAERDRRIDRILTSKITGIPVMLLLFALIFYITVSAANYPSEWLSQGFAFLYHLLSAVPLPDWWKGLLLDGVFSTVASVVSVMLPPMAIFFPLFTLLEDFGYLPRVAFNLDRPFCCAGSNGKNALTMLMGFGCNACGVTGCRIISSPKQRTLAILTNNFSPCNGRFPTLIAVISIFLTGTLHESVQSVVSALILTGVILLSIVISLTVSKLLSLTLFKGSSDTFTLELPPFRKPQIIKIITRSLLDRTVFILGRAVIAAAPAGALIWLLANTDCHGQSLIQLCTQFINPFAHFIGLDGVILLAFLLGFPANEIVLPIAVMIYSSQNVMTDYDSISQLGTILTANGWTMTTAVCMLLFTVMHFPCATACITIYKETKNLKYTLLAFIIPTICGIFCCTLVNIISIIFTQV